MQVLQHTWSRCHKAESVCLALHWLKLWRFSHSWAYFFTLSACFWLTICVHITVNLHRHASQWWHHSVETWSPQAIVVDRSTVYGTVPHMMNLWGKEMGDRVELDWINNGRLAPSAGRSLYLRPHVQYLGAKLPEHSLASWDARCWSSSQGFFWLCPPEVSDCGVGSKQEYRNFRNLRKKPASAQRFCFSTFFRNMPKTLKVKKWKWSVYLKVQDQSSLQVQQGRGFSIVNLQIMKTLLQGNIQVAPFFTLTTNMKTPDHKCTQTKKATAEFCVRKALNLFRRSSQDGKLFENNAVRWLWKSFLNI